MKVGVGSRVYSNPYFHPIPKVSSSEEEGK